MKQEIKYINKVERFEMYVSGELCEEEKNGLEIEFLLNPELKQEYEIYLATNDFLKRNFEELKKNLKEIYGSI